MNNGIRCVQASVLQLPGRGGAGVLLGLILLIPAAQAQLAISVVTEPATAISASGATLNGTVNGNGTDVSAVYFDYGASTAYENIFVNAVPFNVTAAQGATLVSLVIGGLSCGTSYHFRVTADDENGRNAKGDDLSFTTTACPAPEAKPIPATSLWSLLAMSGLLAGAAAWVRRVRNR